ncbi:hypothetical protein CDAR_533631 [Caerostris darwini]|uniref:Secreted protein n=1 Tax=Caerostris darwini TaxID=1538125 RepID=A0AAV4S8Z4_9ARAC|nr:hypothetical protein CDAR_533631 [Caerostris darwini]
MLSMKAIGGAVTGTCSPAMMMMVLTAPASTNLGRMGDQGQSKCPSGGGWFLVFAKLFFEKSNAYCVSWMLPHHLYLERIPNSSIPIPLHPPILFFLHTPFCARVTPSHPPRHNYLSSPPGMAFLVEQLAKDSY